MEEEATTDTSSSSVNDPEKSGPPTATTTSNPPPDSGLTAWLQVLGSFFAWFNTFGLTNAFGVFQTFYQEKFSDQQPAVISLIGSIQPFILIFFGFLGGPLWDAGYCQTLIITGTALTAFGYFMVSICNEFWQVMLVLTIRMRVKPATRRVVRFEYKPFFTEPAYGLYTIALFFCLGAQYTPAFFIQDYALQKHIMSEDLAAYLLPILNAWSIFGRIAPNILADRVGGINMLAPSLMIATILAFSWIGITTSTGLIVFASLYGFFIGSILSMPAFVISSLCPDPKVIGARMGNAFATSSFGMLLEPPVAAVIAQSGDWLGTQLFSAGLLLAATIALIFVRVYIAGWSLRRKV